MLAGALSLGHLWAGLRGHLAVVAHLPGALRRRARVQRGRRVADRALLVSTPTTPNPGLADRGFTATVRRSLDRGFGSYWRVVRRLCG